MRGWKPEPEPPDGPPSISQMMDGFNELNTLADMFVSNTQRHYTELIKSGFDDQVAQQMCINFHNYQLTMLVLAEQQKTVGNPVKT